MTRKRRSQYQETKDKITSLLKHGRSRRMKYIRENVGCSPRTLYNVINDMIHDGLLIKRQKNERHITLRLSKIGMNEISASFMLFNPKIPLQKFKHELLEPIRQNPNLVNETTKNELNVILRQLEKMKKEGII